jgi:hypothetical protein
MESTKKVVIVVGETEDNEGDLILLIGRVAGVLLLASGLGLGIWMAIIKGHQTRSESQAIITFWSTSAQISGLGVLVLVASGLFSFLKSKK